MSDTQHREQRHARLAVRIPARISTIGPEPDPRTGKPCFRVSEETCANVSCGGAFVSMPDPVSPGQRLLLELELPGGARVEALGRVVWSKAVLSERNADEAGIGVEFVGGSSAQFSALEDFIRRGQRRHSTQRPAPRVPLPVPSTGA